MSHARSDARSPAGTRARRELQGRELPGLCFLLSPQNSGLCVLPGLRRPLAPGGRAPLLPSLLHAAGVCPSGPSSRVLQQCPPALLTHREVPGGNGTVLLPGGHSLGRSHPEGTGTLSVLFPCGVELGAASRLLGGGVDPCVGEVLEQGHVHVGLHGNPSQEGDVTVSLSPLPPVPPAHRHGAGARRAAGGRCWGALGGVAWGWRAGGPLVPCVHSPSGPPACG